MQACKAETPTVRPTPEVKDALRQAPVREHRSLANMLEVMIGDWTARAARLSPDSHVVARDRYAGPAVR